MTTKMQAVQISKAGGKWELVERVIPEPGAGQVRVKVEACGMCHSDVLVKEGLWPGLAYPRVPGHEIAGYIDAVGDNVTTLTVFSVGAHCASVLTGLHGPPCMHLEGQRRLGRTSCDAAVKVHRQRVMAKMGTASLAELARMAARLSIPNRQL